MIEENTEKQSSEDKTCINFTTDLQAAYDLVDTKILLKKLEHYQIKENSIKIIKRWDMTNCHTV